MGIFSWIIVGLIAGVLAKWIMPGKDPGGIVVTVLIGIAGAIVGTAATIVAAPFVALTAPPYYYGYYPRPYYGPPSYYPPGYSPQPYNYGPR